MKRTMLALFLTTFVVTLVFTTTSQAGVARVRALAGGDARLLPDDDGTIGDFPNRLNEHQRIAINNVSPDGHPDYDLSSDPFTDFENAETWLEASWEAMGGTAQVGLNRPTSSTFSQRLIADDEGARSMIDLGYANDSWGANGNFGMNSVEGRNPNWFFEGRFGTEMGTGRELAAFFGFNELAGAGKTFDLGLNSRMERGGGFFNYGVGTVSYANANPDADTVGSTNLFGVDATALHYGEGRFASGLTTLVGIGLSYEYLSVGSAGGTPSASQQFIGFPNVTAGGEYEVVSWLDLLGNVSRSFLITLGDAGDAGLTGSASATMGAAAHWGQFRLEAVVINSFFEDGPDFIGGSGSGISSFISAYYNLN